MLAGVGGEPIANGGPGLIVNQRRMLPLEELTLVRNLPGVDRVCEQVVDVPARERFAAARGAIGCCYAAVRPPRGGVGLLLGPAPASDLPIRGKVRAGGVGSGGVVARGALGRIR